MQPEAPKTPDLESLVTGLSKTVAEKADEILTALKFQSLGPERILDFLAWDKAVRMYLPFALQDRLQNLVLRHLHFFEFPLLYRIKELVKPGDVFLDGGANIGNHSIFFSLICEAKTVYAFEPMALSFQTLQKNLSINGISNVVAWNCGLGATASRAQLKRYSHVNSGIATLEPGEIGRYDIISVDSLSLETLDFMKIDVEGSQEEVLKGARETLARCKPMIWIEMRTVGPFKEYESGDALLRDLGYRQLRALTQADYLYVPI